MPSLGTNTVRLVRRQLRFNSAEAEANIAADYDAAIADEAIDKSALEAMALVEAEHGTKEEGCRSQEEEKIG
jgi:SLT domain-containing protein